MRARVLLASAALAVTTLVGGAASAAADADANGTAENSPGVLSGNLIQVPVDVPVNLCGNSVNVVGVLNPATGNSCPAGH